MAKLVSMLAEWNKVDFRYKHIDVRKSFLQVLGRLSATPSGRSAVLAADGIAVLFELYVFEHFSCVPVLPN